MAMGVTKVPNIIDRLFVYDVHVLDHIGTHEDDVHRVMRFYADQTLPGARAVGVSGITNLVSTLQSYTSIGTLSLFTHGLPGGIGMVELSPAAKGSAGETSHPSNTVNTQIPDFLALFRGVFPVANEIRLEGCNVASGLEEMVSLKRAFNADRVSGYNMFHALGHGTLWASHPDVVTQELYDAYVANLELGGPVPADYYLPGATDLREMIGSTGSGLTVWEWFSENIFTDLTSVPDRSLCFRRDDRQVLTFTEEEALAKFYFFDKTPLVELVVVD